MLPIRVNLMMESILSCETSVLKRGTTFKKTAFINGKLVPKDFGKGVSAVTVQQVPSQRFSAHGPASMEIRW
jgi:hypothetical protein